jgi:hypothetical protein
VIYFIRAVNSGTIKIGVSNDPKRRLESMQTGSPEPLELLGILPGGVDEERRLHGRFKAYRIHGEWFRGDAVLMRAIELMVEKPIGDLLDERLAEVWLIVGKVWIVEDGCDDEVTLVCVLLHHVGFDRSGRMGGLCPDPDEMLQAVMPGGQFSYITSIANVTQCENIWPIPMNRVRDVLVNRSRGQWVFHYDGENPFVAARVPIRVDPDKAFRIGSKVVHPQYGVGEVLCIEGEAPELKGRIRFIEHGERTFVLAKSPLRLVPGPEVN